MATVERVDQNVMQSRRIMFQGAPPLIVYVFCLEDGVFSGLCCNEFLGNTKN